MNIPSNIKEYIIKNDYKINEVLQFNQNKGIFVIKISRNNIFFILKGYCDYVTISIKNKFFVEKHFLKKFSKCNIFPTLIEEFNNFIIIEFLEGRTLRKFLIENNSDDISDNIKVLLQGLNKFNTCLEKFKKTRNLNSFNLKSIDRYIYVLALSTPFQLKCQKFSLKERIINKIVALLLNLRIKFFFKKYRNEKITYIEFSHNDFHYNNILVGNRNIKFIDFENIEYNGDFNIDILFLLVLMEGLGIKNTELKEFILKIVSKNKFYYEVYNTFSKIITYNKRFYI